MYFCTSFPRSAGLFHRNVTVLLSAFSVLTSLGGPGAGEIKCVARVKFIKDQPFLT